MTGRSTKNARIIFAVCFFALITISGLSAVFACFKKHLAVKAPQFVNQADVPAISTFQELYPFDDTAEDELFETPEVQRNPDCLSGYCTICHRCKYTVERYSASQNPLMRLLYCPAAALDKATGRKVIENGKRPIIRLPNGYFAYAFSDTDSPESWEKMRNFSVWLKKRNIPLLQLLPATKMDDSITVFPPGIPHGYSRMIEQYKSFLAENHIPYIDAKEVLMAENGDFYSWFYKTDHHWNVFAGRLMAEFTARKLNGDFKIAADVDAVKDGNFTLIRYSAVFFGSLSKKAGASPEDFEIFYPQKDGRFHLEIPSRGIDRTGGFSQTLIASTYLQSSNTYCCFLYGDQPLIQIENKNCTNGTRVLVIKHSQADVLCPYLACAVHYLDVIDPRHFDGSIKTFIERTQPDAVLICI